jgi:hypothetical protein
MTVSKPQALFAISSLGLGHATRSLAVLRAFLQQGYAVTVICDGAALSFLQRELASEAAVSFQQIPDYPPLERGTGWRYYWYLLVDLLKTWLLIVKEHRAVQPLADGYELIFSDGRYGIRSRFVPSYILTHQIAFIPPKGFSFTRGITKYLNHFALRQFDCILIPDFPDQQDNLSGVLAHARGAMPARHCFVGILSSYQPINIAQDIDYLFIVSGYLVEHKNHFVGELLSQARRLEGRKVFVLGTDQGSDKLSPVSPEADLQVYGMVSGRLRQELFNRSRRIISRAGYSTIMDLVEHGRRALLIPTPNQTEQEYLAAYLGGRNLFATRRQKEQFDLVQAVAESEQKAKFVPPWTTQETLRRISAAVEPMLRKQFFSIVVPAHNEEAELLPTLHALLAQDYPGDRYEILIVENGSMDNTLRIAQSVASGSRAICRISVIQCAQGVSIAKNTGLQKTSPRSDWVIFCDADTRLGPFFLGHLNTWLNRNGKRLSVGTAQITPHPGAHRYARLWFALFNQVHRLSKTSFSLQVARTSVARQVGFDESLQLAEDLLFLRRCREYGDFFFLPTNQVSTSVRRFAANGYLRQSIRWLFESLLPLPLKRKKRYDVVR